MLITASEKDKEKDKASEPMETSTTEATEGETPKPEAGAAAPPAAASDEEKKDDVVVKTEPGTQPDTTSATTTTPPTAEGEEANSQDSIKSEADSADNKDVKEEVKG